MSSTTAAPPRTPPFAAVVLLLTAVISVLLIAFGWAAVTSSVHGVPIAVVGPDAAVSPVTAALDKAAPGAFEVVSEPTTAAAESAIHDREVYGAIDLSSGSPQLTVASAGSLVVSQALQSVATGLGQATGTTVPVHDLAPLPASDPRGAGLAAGALPLVMGGMLAAALLTRLVNGTTRRVAGALAFSVTGGLALVAILQFWFGSLGGDYLANSGAVALSIAATSLTILGLESLLGAVGLGIGGALVLLVGNPLSGISSAPEMLPGWSGQLGQLLPPGAGASLLRSTAFFDSGGAAAHIAVLVMWLLVGLALCTAGGARSARANRAPAVAAVAA